MTIDRIKYTKEFSYHGMSEWMGCEASIEPTENPVTAVLELREKMIAAFKETLSQAEPAVAKQDYKPEEPDIEFEKVKAHLQTIEFREDAQAYIETTEYHLTIEAKKIINSKPLKTK